MVLGDMAGTLYVVATPIGNLEDFSRRGANVLASVAMIAAEDTRRTRVLLEAFGASAPQVIALHSHNETEASRAALARLHAGEDVALVSDAGTPLLSDPGYELVRACWGAGIAVVPVPGPSALITALSVCPLPAGRFLFEGFLPAKAAAREERLLELVRLGVLVVFYEAPHRMAATLKDVARLAPGRRLMIAREMTKRHEQYLCDLPDALLQTLERREQLKGEFVCVLEAGAPAVTPPEVRRTMEILTRDLPPAQAARLGAQLLGRSKRELYDLAMRLRES
jgi:16S rRNA (cytidine1402-2'-O)-methyltransferase